MVSQGRHWHQEEIPSAKDRLSRRKTGIGNFQSRTNFKNSAKSKAANVALARSTALKPPPVETSRRWFQILGRARQCSLWRAKRLLKSTQSSFHERLVFRWSQSSFTGTLTLKVWTKKKIQRMPSPGWRGGWRSGGFFECSQVFFRKNSFRCGCQDDHALQWVEKREACFRNAPSRGVALQCIQ
jgi:hypothetical protein